MRLDQHSKYRPAELKNVKVEYNSSGKRTVTCFCGEKITYSIVPHLKKCHSSLWDEWTKIFVELRGSGYSLRGIMRLFGSGDGKLLFSWTVIENEIRAKVEAGDVTYSPPPKKIAMWHPQVFKLESTTVWDFPRRGSWAVHTGDYRGNWPPQIPRNLILKYTSKDDLVVDAFVGGGTTLIEAWLLGRRSIGIDLGLLAIQTTEARLTELESAQWREKGRKLKETNKPKVALGNALSLCDVLLELGIHPEQVKLLCAHPPYLGSVRYGGDSPANLALIKDPLVFYDKMCEFAKQVYKCIAPDGICAMLIGDARKKGVVEPLGLRTLNCFLSEKFLLENIVVKTQHQDMSSEFYHKKESVGLLIAHEYLFILRKT
jgi:hypothetical protein